MRAVDAGESTCPKWFADRWDQYEEHKRNAHNRRVFSSDSSPLGAHPEDVTTVDAHAFLSHAIVRERTPHPYAMEHTGEGYVRITPMLF